MSESSAPTTLRRDRSAAKQLFFGDIFEDNLFPYPTMRERDREMLGAMLDSIDDFVSAHKGPLKEWDEHGEQPQSFIQGLRDMGLFGLIIPEEHGGLELSNAAYARVLGQTSGHDSSVSLTIGAHSSIGMKGLLLWGTDEQKARYLPRLASGELIAAFCLTESGAGSDAASIRTKAEKQADGTWLLNGEKIWITNGGIAGFYTVFARTDGPGGKMSAFIVEAGWPGVAHGPHEHKMGIRSNSTTTVSFTDVRVPADCLLGEEGKGFKVAMSILNNGRTGLGGGAVGGMKNLIKLATAQAKDRKQFGKPIADYGLVREKIAQMAVDCFVAESTVFMVAHYIDSGVEDYSIEAAMSKVFASEAIQRCAHEALQIAAGNGFMKEYPYEKVTRDSRILSIFEGTNEILRLYVALSGLKDVGASLGELKSAVGAIFNDPIKGFGVLSGYAQRRFSQSTGIGADRILRQLPPRLAKCAAVYEKYASELARVGDEASDANADQAQRIVEVYTAQARRRMYRNVRGMQRNEDAAIDALAGAMLDGGKYPWDVV
jgi:acyl-CoA dehydrogenase family member 9